ncbi:fibronectin type-III domain-containing protein 3A-like isoform X2 [Tigriopus californicus]|uniref:fibronectin type-III domain-containing protein 3A-like isoform X2 n=1 Tax=Tigriopus californicus TaxID=6832 RepID=UPI0027DA2EE6|nr:fibronectin type-III domain-containing protein 3A-like isoform X2 [Tigriopus californicus]
MNQSETPVACTDPSPPSQNGGSVDSKSCPQMPPSLATPSETNSAPEVSSPDKVADEVSPTNDASPPTTQTDPIAAEPEIETPGLAVAPAVAPAVAEASVPAAEATPMQLPVNGPAAPGSTGVLHGTVTHPQPQQHSPGSTSSMSSNGSGAHVGYTRQSNPRPRSNKHAAGVTTPISVPASSAAQAPTVLSSLPPSAISAQPYYPTQSSHMVDYSHQPPYCAGFVPTGPSDAPPYGTVYYHPGTGYESGPGYVSGPPPAPVMGHPPRPPAKANASGRYTPSPHSMSGSSSPSSFCQNNNVTTTSVCGAGSGSANASSNSNSNNNNNNNNNNQHVVTYHVHSGEVISLQLGDGQVQVIPGPATIRMVSTNSTPPVPLPMQVPPGHMVQQILDQNGTLQHVILSLDPMAPGTNGTPGPFVPPPGASNAPTGTPTPSGGIIHYGLAPPPPHSGAPGSGAPPSIVHHISNGAGATPLVGAMPVHSVPNAVYATPTYSSNSQGRAVSSTTPSGGPRHGVFSPNPLQYGPPPSIPMMAQSHVAPPGHSPPPPHHHPPQQQQQPQPQPQPPQQPHVQHIGPHHPHWHGTHPPNFPGGDKSHSGPPVRIRDATHERLKKKANMRQQQQQQQQHLQQQFHHHHHQQHQGGTPSQHSTPATSPAKRGVGTRDSYRINNTNNANNNSSSHGSNSGGSATSSSLPGGLLPHKLSSKAGSPSTGVDQSRHEDSEESGVGHEEEEEIQQLLVELLSNVRTPKVSDINARSVLLNWGLPIREGEGSKFDALEPIPESEYRYEVLLSDKGKDGKYRSIFNGHSLDCHLTDLRPCTEYHIRIHVLLENLRGGASDTVSFVTQSCEPDQPVPPKLIQRTKTTINLRWNAPADNGAHIQNYVLEYEEALTGQGSNYVEIYRGRAKSFNVTKLKSSTHYRFRLCAINELGQSQYSESIVFSTQGTAPSPPHPPGLHEVTKSSIHLVWSKRVSDDKFMLQMDDMKSGHGFITCYNDSNVEYICSDLRRNTKYKFRLQAINEEGESPWSDSVVYSTLPDIPGPPVRPASKGRIHPSSFKVRWDPPADNGGSSITGFLLELAQGPNAWRTVYQGLSCECVCEDLQPGTQYKVRVACTSGGGVSQYSEVCNISTEPVVPGQCASPRVHGKPKANSLHLKWGWPETDGGSPVMEFEIDMTSPDNQTRAVYRGQETECVVASLLPGRPYLFQVRAHNRAGAGPWSESLEVVSGAGSPDQPKEPKVVCRSGSLALITWEPPINNGALIQEYQLQMVLIRRTVVQYQRQTSNPSVEEEDRDDEDEESAISSDEDVDDDDDHTEDELSGSDVEADNKLKNKKSNLPAVKSSGIWNPDPEDDPDDLEDVEEEAVIFEEVVRGSEYHTIYTGAALQFEAKGLEPACVYHFRMCAVNAAGPSLWSNDTEIRTPAAPPTVVGALRLVSSTSESLSLAWPRPTCHGEPVIHYNVDTGTSVLPTPGPDTRFVLDQLKPDTSYNIRVQAVNSMGPGPFSATSRLSTRPLPPAPPKCECIHANHNSLKLRWGDSKVGANTELCQYTLEMENSRNQFQIIYNGASVSHKVNKLTENSRYRFRISASNEAGQGAFSQVYEFSTAYALPPPLKSPPRVTGITTDGCLVEWSSVKASALHQSSIPPSDIQYKVFMTKGRESKTRIVYGGTDLQFRLNGLEAKSEYAIKVAVVRIPEPELELVGAHSPPCAFTTLAAHSGLDGQASASETATAQSTRKWSLFPRQGEVWSIEQKAMGILVGFTIFAVLVSMLVQQFMAWGGKPS